MDDLDNAYSPQSPDLSAYHSTYSADHSLNYPHQPSYQTSYPQSASYNHPQTYPSAQPTQLPTSYSTNMMSSNGKLKNEVIEDEWTPEASARTARRKPRKQMPEETIEKSAPGSGNRIEVKTKFPVARIKRIMQADEDVGKVAQVTPTAVSKALELFMIAIVTSAAFEAKMKSSKRITQAHFKQALMKDERFDFLADIIANIPDAPAPKKEEDSEEIGEGKKKRGATRRKKRDSDDLYTRDGDSRGATYSYSYSYLHRGLAIRQIFMEFWSRLISGAGDSPSSRQSSIPNHSQQRLIRFKRGHAQLLQVWQKSSKKLSIDPTVAENLSMCLLNLQSILKDEIQAPAPHLCIADVAESRLYVLVSSIASTSYNESIIHEALAFFNILINTEEENFLEYQGFADIFIEFVSDISTSGPVMVDVEIEGEMVELLFGVAAKLRLRPEVLPMWFRRNTQDLKSPEEVGRGGFVPKSHKEEFPLFYLLLDYVHHDGKVGDFARTGLLYLIESSVHSEDLEKWVVESDLASLMASGLGALYSQLSRKLVLSFPRDSIPTILSLSDDTLPPIPYDADETASLAFQAHLKTFLSHLVFWQDVLEHCTSIDIKQTLLDHFQFLFLQQLLYPSLLESSDADGGSVAVLTYLQHVLESIDHLDLIQLILQYLLAIPQKQPEDPSPSRPTTLARRRKSQDLITNMADNPPPALFNLVDLIRGGLQSRDQQTITSTLRLISVLMRKQHRYTISTLVTIAPSGEEDTKRTIGVHNRDTKLLLHIAERLAKNDHLEDIYETHLHDARTVLENHPCSGMLLTLPDIRGFTTQSSILTCANGEPELIRVHTIRSDDPLLSSLFSLLENFLANDVQTNLSLTQTFVVLASCGYTRLEGWLLSSTAEDEIAISLEEEPIIDMHDTLSDISGSSTEIGDAEKWHAMKLAHRVPSQNAKPSSLFFNALDCLGRQVDSHRQSIQDFDAYLTDRRNILDPRAEMDEVPVNLATPIQESGDSQNASPARSKNLPQMDSISQRLSADKTSSNVSRSNSPRGRQQNRLSSSTLPGRLSHPHIVPSLSPSQGSSRPHSTSPPYKKPVSEPPKPPLIPLEILQRKLRLTDRHRTRINHLQIVGSSESSSTRSPSRDPEVRLADDGTEVSLSHLLTNVIILQEFVIELAAIVEVRASLFDEVKFV